MSISHHLESWKSIQRRTAQTVDHRPTKAFTAVRRRRRCGVFVRQVDRASPLRSSTIARNNGSSRSLTPPRRSRCPTSPATSASAKGPRCSRRSETETRVCVICFDGQGIAHPRRCGLATHLGVTLDVPAIGVAKSRFIGTYDEPAEVAGSISPLMDKDEQIGVVLRSKDRTRPLFVSVGHRVDLASAVELVRPAEPGFRIPEPTRQADIEVAASSERSGTAFE